MSGQWKEFQRSSTQYGWSRRISNIPIHAWDRSQQRLMSWHGRRHANRGGSQTEVKRACVCVAVDALDYMRCECKSVDSLYAKYMEEKQRVLWTMVHIST